MQSKIDRLEVSAFNIPTDFPESDGTLEWNSTTLVLVEISVGKMTGLGFTYADTATATLIRDRLKEIVLGCDAMNVPEIWNAMISGLRNLGRPGICSMAIAAVDLALWDLKARLFEVPLVQLLGAAKSDIPVYGSGGFTSYPIARLQKQLVGWVRSGISRVKIKVGREPEKDFDRVEAARSAIGPKTELFVDANGGYTRKQALAFAEAFADFEVSWFEEPVMADDLDGLRLLRDRGPGGMDIAAGEYGYDVPYFERLLGHGAVDVLQADITRCAGLTEFMRVGALCAAREIPLSAHTAPSLHVHPCCAMSATQHIEYFHDHARIEQMLFDGAAKPVRGLLAPDLSRSGCGLELKRKDAKKFSI